MHVCACASTIIVFGAHVCLCSRTILSAQADLLPDINLCSTRPYIPRNKHKRKKEARGHLAIKSAGLQDTHKDFSDQVIEYLIEKRDCIVSMYRYEVTFCRSLMRAFRISAVDLDFTKSGGMSAAWGRSLKLCSTAVSKPASSITARSERIQLACFLYHYKK